MMQGHDDPVRLGLVERRGNGYGTAGHRDGKRERRKREGTHPERGYITTLAVIAVALRGVRC